MNNEFPPQEIKKSFSQIEKEMAEKGFKFAGIEDFSKEKHRPGSGSIRIVQTRESIIRDYLDLHRLEIDSRETEIELVDKDPQSVYVFAKKIDNSNWQKGGVN